jgi:hypothetical protein
MEGFVRINDVLINTNRLMAVQRKAGGNGPVQDYYLAVFDTGQELMLTPVDGAILAEHCQSLLTNPSDGTMAMTSESAT